MLALAPPAECAAKKKSRSPWTLSLRAEAEIRYDDNIIGLSSREIDLLDKPGVDPESRFGVESEDDLIFAPDLVLKLSREPRRGLDTDIYFTARPYDYLRNSRKDYQQFTLSVRQDLNRSRDHQTVVFAGVSTIPSYFLRRLRDDDESDPGAGITVRNDADYRLTKGFAGVDQEIIRRLLSVTGRYAIERRNYNRHFDERDARSDVFSLDVDIYPLRRILFRIRPYYEYESRDARGGDGLSTTVVVDDVGFHSNRIGADLRWLWGPDSDHRRIVSVFGEIETRSFSSRDAADPGHFDREDDISKFGAEFDRELGPAWKWEVSAYHRQNSVSTRNGTTTFRKNVLSAALTYRFEERLGRR